MTQAADQRIDDTLRKLTVVSQPILVEGLARELLRERPVEFLAELISSLGRRATEERARIVYMGVFRLALQPESIPDQVRQDIYSVLAGRGEGALVRHFLPVAAARSSSEVLGPHDPALEDMTLGMRKWKARLHDREFLLRLGRQYDPAVLAVLLDNPLLTEADVVTWTARRPGHAGCLTLIASHRKWSVRPQIQAALARNPYTPTHIAAALMPLFTRATLREIADDGTLHPLVRAAANEVLVLRSVGE